MLLKNVSKLNFIQLNDYLEKKNAYKNFYLFIMGVLVSAVSVSVFYKPYDIVTSGSTGIAILITKFINVDLSLIIFLVSAILMIIGFIVFGFEYGSKNIIITIISPIFIKFATLINRVVNLEGSSVFLLAIVAGLLSGIGFGLIKKSGYSPGGLCVIYDIINKKFKLSVGTASLIVNTLIMLFSLFVFGLTGFIYGFIALYVSTTVADRVMIGISNNKAFYIITRKSKEVKECIINNLKHTVTIVNAKGGYTNKKKKILLCVIPTKEYIKVKEVIREIDSDAFFLVTDSYYVSK